MKNLNPHNSHNETKSCKYIKFTYRTYFNRKIPKEEKIETCLENIGLIVDQIYNTNEEFDKFTIFINPTLK